jgi:hypothetical protein
MAVYIVKRHFGAVSDLEMEAAGHRSAACVPYYPGMHWLHTFWDEERLETTCIYEAEDPDHIRDHARRAGIPCDDIHEVTALPVEDFVGSSRAGGTVAQGVHPVA